jgi:hypothetical protein
MGPPEFFQWTSFNTDFRTFLNVLSWLLTLRKVSENRAAGLFFRFKGKGDGFGEVILELKL